MWVKRSPKELVRANRRKKFGAPIFVISFATFLAILGVFKTDYWESVPSEGRWSRWPNLFLSGLFVGVLCLILKPRSQVICPKCGRIERKDPFTKCECGGCFEKIEEMKWIDEK